MVPQSGVHTFFYMVAASLFTVCFHGGRGLDQVSRTSYTTKYTVINMKLYWDVK